jgi:drug/metabolite transporter superfamily protein YnfA
VQLGHGLCEPVFSVRLYVDRAGSGRQPQSHVGGVYIGVTIVWLWAIDEVRPTPLDAVADRLLMADS